MRSQDTRSIHKNQSHFYITNNEYMKSEIKNTISFTITPNKIKYLGELKICIGSIKDLNEHFTKVEYMNGK